MMVSYALCEPAHRFTSPIFIIVVIVWLGPVANRGVFALAWLDRRDDDGHGNSMAHAYRHAVVIKQCDNDEGRYVLGNTVLPRRQRRDTGLTSPFVVGEICISQFN
jgi:hypothetical protein